MLTGYTDVTPFLSYFCKEVYNRLQSDTASAHTDFKVYQQALADGKITEKNAPALGICFVGLRNLGVYDQAVGKGFPQCSLRHNPNLCYEIP